MIKLGYDTPWIVLYKFYVWWHYGLATIQDGCLGFWLVDRYLIEENKILSKQSVGGPLQNYVHWSPLFKIPVLMADYVNKQGLH